jgi:hypothetical protein
MLHYITVITWSLRSRMILEIVWIIKNVKDSVLCVRVLERLICLGCFWLEVSMYRSKVKSTESH